ncbi:MAG: (2Fe-2S)-binding protein [Bacteriovoracaceae bacterium]|nr:(2Fe-2S)-binding protein [Bacteriovoracaceae bacterium]
MPRVSLSESNQSFEVAAESVIYDALSDQGLDLPHGCLAGSCGACRIHVSLGSENLSPAGAIEKNTIEAIQDEYRKSVGEEFLKDKHIRLSCRARVKGDVTITPLSRK